MLSAYFYQAQLNTNAPNNVLEAYKKHSYIFKHYKVNSVLSLKNLFEKDKEILRTVLASYGYFDSTVQYIISKEKDYLVLNVFLILKQQFSIKNIYFSGISQNEEKALKKLIKNKENSFLDEQALSESLKLIEDYFKNKGYPFILVFTPKIELNFSEKNMNLYIHIDKGDKKFFGPVVIENMKHLKEDFVRAYFAWKEGNVYQKDLIEQTKKRLLNSGLISYIDIKHDFSDDKNLPMKIKIYEAPRKVVIGEIGYSKELGKDNYGELSGRLSWAHRNLGGYGESIQLSGEMVQYLRHEWPRIKNAQIKHKMPHIFKSSTWALVADISYADEEASAYTGYTGKISGGFEKKITDNLVFEGRILFDIANVKKDIVTFSSGNFQIQPLHFDTKMVSFPLLLSWHKMDDAFDPKKGFNLSARFEPNIVLEGSETSGKSIDKLFGLLQMSFEFPLLLYKRGAQRLLFYNKLSIGEIVGAQFDEVIPHKRFYLGGIRTLPAYGEKRVGDIDAKGRPFGGASFFMVMPEVRVRFQDVWGINIHYEAGFVSKQSLLISEDKDFFHGCGISAVYYSRIGPIQGGVAFPFKRRTFYDDSKEEKKDSLLQIYITVGQM